MPNPPHPIQQMNDKYARRCGELALQWRLVHREREDGDKMFTRGRREGATEIDARSSRRGSQ